MAMTSYERYAAVCELREPDRAPVSPFIMTFAARLMGVPYIDYCRSGEVMAQAQLQCIRRFGYDAVALGSDAVREAETVGASVFWQEDGVPGTTEEPFIKSRDDLKRLRLPDPLGDIHASGEYRVALAKAYGKRALKAARDRAGR